MQTTTEDIQENPWENLNEFFKNSKDFLFSSNSILNLIMQRLVAFETTAILNAYEQNKHLSSETLPAFDEFWLKKFGFNMTQEEKEKVKENALKILTSPAGIDFRIIDIKKYLLV